MFAAALLSALALPVFTGGGTAEAVGPPVNVPEDVLPTNIPAIGADVAAAHGFVPDIQPPMGHPPE